MKNFLIVHEAVIGRSIDNEHPPMDLTFYTVQTGVSTEAVNDMVVQYNDPTFKTKIKDVIELGDEISVSELKKLLDPQKVLTEQKL